MTTSTGLPVDADEILSHGKHAENIPLSEVVSALSAEEKDKLLGKYEMRRFVKIFEDGETMQTVKGFLGNGMNISLTARNTYMHRNTLMYRLNRIRKITGLDLRNFEMAVTFQILYFLYKNK